MPSRDLHKEPFTEETITKLDIFALFIVEAMDNDELIHEVPAIVGCQTPSAFSNKSVS